MNTYYGADISRWQGVVNWPAFNPGAAFVFFKGGGGDDGNYVDSQFQNNLAGARSLGNQMPHGVYWFLEGTDPVGEANFFLENIANQLQVGEVVVVDCETGSAVNPATVQQFLDVVTPALGFKPLLYMSDNTILTHDWSAIANADYGLWAADWAVTPAENVPLKYWPFYAFQQYEDNGTFPGISGNVDADAFFAPSLNTFFDYGKQAVMPPPVIPATPVPTTPPVEPVPPPAPPTTPPVPAPPTPKPPTPKPVKISWLDTLINAILRWWRK